MCDHSALSLPVSAFSTFEQADQILQSLAWSYVIQYHPTAILLISFSQ